jgi:sulfite reductase (ferredoxin)
VRNYLADRKDGESFAAWVEHADEALLRGDQKLEPVA